MLITRLVLLLVLDRILHQYSEEWIRNTIGHSLMMI